MKKKFSVKDFLISNNTYIIFVGLIIVCAILSPNFLTMMNIRNIGLQQCGPVCVVLGMLFVILTGGIDLSVGSVMALGSSLAGYLIIMKEMHYLPAIILTLIAGLAAGLIGGILVAYANFQGFVATLAVMTMARGAALMITKGQPIRIADMTSLPILANRDAHYPMLFIMLIIIIGAILIQKYTTYGRVVIALGSNRQAVDLAGIRSRRYLVAVYAISGILASLGGVFIAARAATGSAVIAEGQELDAIAACVIGGANLAGGKGDVFKAVIGALVLALIGNIMNLCSVPAYPQDVIKGVIIIVAVLLQLVTDKDTSK